MKNYKRSICSTCSFLSFCSLTTDKSNIHSCSEYEHYLEHPQEKSKVGQPIIQYTPKAIKSKRQLVLS